MAVERRTKASHSEFKEIWPGLKRCMVCGFTLATHDSDEKCDEVGKENKPKYPKEDSLHSTYHGKFYKAKNEYGYSNVLDYKVLKAKEEALTETLATIKANDITADVDTFPNVYREILDIVSEAEKWVKGYSSFTSPVFIQLSNEVMNSIREIREKAHAVQNNRSVEVFQESLYDILPVYRHIFDIIQNIIMLRVPSDKDSYYEEYKNIELPTFSFNVDEKINYIETILQIIPTKQTKVDAALQDVYTIEYTKSLRLWDMCKPHPKFEDYVALLWNTPKFVTYIAPYMTETQIAFYKEKYKCNRQLVDFGFTESPFYFGRVLVSDICEAKKRQAEEVEKILSEMTEDEAKKAKKKITEPICNKDCANCPFKFRDLTYTDRLSEMSDEDEDTSDGFENTKEYKEAAKTLEVLGKLGKILSENA